MKASPCSPISLTATSSASPSAPPCASCSRTRCRCSRPHELYPPQAEALSLVRLLALFLLDGIAERERYVPLRQYRLRVRPGGEAHRSERRHDRPGSHCVGEDRRNPRV